MCVQEGSTISLRVFNDLYLSWDGNYIDKEEIHGELCSRITPKLLDANLLFLKQESKRK